MHGKIFRSNMLTSMLVLVTTLLLIAGVLIEHFEYQLTDELKNEAMYIEQGIKNEGLSYLKGFDDKQNRITIISKDGTVLADTYVDETEFDNHTERKEVKQAITDGEGTSVRYSDTLLEKTIYYAKQTENGDVLRVSATQQSVLIIVLGLLHPILVICVIALILALILSYRVSKSITTPLNELDLENPENNETYEELTPLLSKIAVQNRKICEQLKNAEQKQEEFRLITENMTEGFLVIDNNAQLLTCNGAAMKILDMDDKEKISVLAVNRTKGFRDTVHKVLAGERTENAINLEDKHYSLIANPVYEDDNVIGAVIVILDVTENVNREKMRSEFTSNVSHELKTPLTSISGFAEMMMGGDADKNTVIDFSKSIYDEAQRLISLVGDIIKISELDERSEEFERETVDLSELAKSVAVRLQPATEKKNISVNVLGGTSKIVGVRKILDEMIGNLLDNAIKYNKENGTVDIIVTSSEDKAELTVRDNGIGIPPADRDRVFERFYCVDKSRSKLVGGTGLGLSIVKHGAMYHNAEIKLDSIVDKGTTITLSFDRYYE